MEASEERVKATKLAQVGATAYQEFLDRVVARRGAEASSSETPAASSVSMDAEAASAAPPEQQNEDGESVTVVV